MEGAQLKMVLPICFELLPGGFSVTWNLLLPSAFYLSAVDLVNFRYRELEIDGLTAREHGRTTLCDFAYFY